MAAHALPSCQKSCSPWEALTANQTYSWGTLTWTYSRGTLTYLRLTPRCAQAVSNSTIWHELMFPCQMFMWKEKELINFTPCTLHDSSHFAHEWCPENRTGGLTATFLAGDANVFCSFQKFFSWYLYHTTGMQLPRAQGTVMKIWLKLWSHLLSARALGCLSRHCQAGKHTFSSTLKCDWRQ